MSQQKLERGQVWIYLAAILAGLAIGNNRPELSDLFETALWPLLALLLYSTFTQIPLAHLPQAIRDYRFMGAILIGNFIIMPLVVWGLLIFLPDIPAIRLGVLLVLLMPCTDWYMSFTHLAGGDTRRAIAATPVNLLVQLCMLPIYLWLFMGETFLELTITDRIIPAFTLLIIMPLLAAWLTRYMVHRNKKKKEHKTRQDLIEKVGWLPVPLLAIVVFLVAAAHVQTVVGALPILSLVPGIFAAFLVAAILVGMLLTRMFKLPATSGHALIFSLGTRNSFVVLPLALALSAQWQAATVVIVLQSLVELFGMVVYLWLIPRLH